MLQLLRPGTNLLAVFPMLVLLAESGRAAVPESPPGPRVEIEVVRPPTDPGTTVTAGDTVEVRYRGQVRGEAPFVDTLADGSTLHVVLRPDRVIRGWLEGVEGMGVGEQRRLTVPPHLAYGEQGFGDLVPPGATLGFLIELVSVGEAAGDPSWRPVAPGLRILDLTAGEEPGPVAAAAHTLTVHYTGWLADGTEFDSSRARGHPFTFTLGRGQVIRGWDLGLEGMRPGGRRRLEIRPELAYGARGTSDGRIPGDATLLYEVQLLRVEPPESGDPTYFDPERSVTCDNGVVVLELQAGSGPPPRPGDRVTVHYTGWLSTGRQLDSTYRLGEPFSFVVGRGQVIQGWEETITSMPLGCKRRVRLPPELGYGVQGRGPVPPNATLIYEIEVIAIERSD
jgi:peptidylprolyl isomerase